MTTKKKASKKTKDDPIKQERDAIIKFIAPFFKLSVDPTVAIIWLPKTPRNSYGSRLLEVINPTNRNWNDDKADEAMEFLPTATFPYGHQLYHAKIEDFLLAIECNLSFAQEVADGMPLPEANDYTKRLQTRARMVLMKAAKEKQEKAAKKKGGTKKKTKAKTTKKKAAAKKAAAKKKGSR